VTAVTVPQVRSCDTWKYRYRRDSRLYKNRQNRVRHLYVACFRQV